MEVIEHASIGIPGPIEQYLAAEKLKVQCLTRSFVFVTFECVIV